jgi:hypothetical protein
MRRSLRDRLFAPLQAASRRRNRDAKTALPNHWRQPALEELESRRVLSAQDLHPDGTPFQVADSQYNTFVAADGNGNSIVTWQAQPSGSSGMAIYAQQYNNQGHALGSTILVAGPLGSGGVQSAGVVADASGDFMVIWNATAASGNSSLQGQRYNAQGVGQGSTVPLPGNANDDQFSLDASGNLLVVYESNSALFGQRYNTLNNPVGQTFQIDPTVPAGPFELAADTDGSFMVSWFAQASSAGATDLYARGFNKNSVAQSSEFLVVSSSDTASAAFPEGLSMAGYGSGNFIIQWQNQALSSGAVATSLFAQRFNLQGTALDRQIAIAPPTTLGVNSTSIAAQDDGSFLIAGVPAGPSGNENGIYAEHFGADDSPEGVAFPLLSPNVFAVDSNHYPLVFAGAQGNYLTSWVQTATPTLASQQTYISYFVASATNQAPQTVGTISDQSVAARDVVQTNLSGYFTDPESDPLVYSLTVPGGGLLPSWLSLTDAGVLSAVPPLTAAGLSYPLQITATDMNGASVSEIFALDVTSEAHGQTGNQFPVNTNSKQAVVASNADGDEVVISTSANNNLVGQLYNSQGQASGSQFTVASANFDNVPGLPSVAMNAAGDFVVTWVESANGEAPLTSDVPSAFEPQVVYMRTFNAQAAPGGPATPLALPNNEVPQGIPQVVADGTGEFDVAWLSTSTTFQTTLWLQRFDAGGTAQTSPINALGSTFSTPNPAVQETYLGISADAVGNLTLMWGVGGTGGPSPSTGTINAELLDANNNAIGSAFVVTSSAASVNPAIAEDPAGDFEIAWWQYAAGLYSLEVQPYSPQGSAIGGPQTIGTPSAILNQASASQLTGGPLGNITADPAGHFLVTWYGFSPTQAAGTVTNEIYGQILDSQGNPIGGPFQVNTTGAAKAEPKAAMDAAGNFIVIWTDGATGTGIDAQRYAPGISIGVPALQVAVENSPAEFVDTNHNQITYSDSYGNNGVEQISLVAPDGTLSLGSITGITFTAGANGTSSMTVQGTVTNLSSALSGLTFTPTTGFTGSASLMINADNLGDSGSSGHLTASTTVRIEVLSQSPFQVLGNTITVDSTGLGDNFFLRYASATQLALTLDGYSEAFDPTTVSQVEFDGQSNSAATVSGDGSVASAVFQPNSLTFTLASGLEVDVTNTPTITADGHAGDTAVFYGDATANTFIGTADSSTMISGGSTNTARDFGSVYGVARNALDTAYLSSAGGTFIGTPSYSELLGTTGGQPFFVEAEGYTSVLATNDPGTSATAYFYDSDGSQPIVSTFVATPSSAYMNGAGFNNSTTGYATVVAFAGGANSIAYLNDTQGSNTFVTTLSYAYFVGPNSEFNEQVIGFPQVIGIAGLGANDTAYLYGLAGGGNDYYGYSGSSYLFGGGMNDWAVNFRNVLSVVTGGTNQAFFTGGPETNTFFGYSNFSAMVGGNFDNGAMGFTSVYAVGSGTGNVADLYDSTGDDALFAGGSALSLIYPASSIGLSDFDEVTANSTQGGHDTASVSAIDFALTLNGPWVHV